MATGIAALALDGEHKQDAEPVRATVTLEGPVPKGSTVIFEVLDNYGRCVAREKAAASGTLEFTGDTSQSLHLYNYVNVTLIDSNGVTLDEARRAFVIAHPSPPTDDIGLMVWEAGASLNPRMRPITTRFSQLGVDAVLNGPRHEIAQACVMANMHLVPYVTRLHPEAVNADGVRSPCLTSPGYNDTLRKRLVDTTRDLKWCAPLSYSLGDDQSYLRAGQEGCWSPTCRQALGEWAIEKYGTLEDLNKAWSTDFADVADIEPIRRAEALEAMTGDFGGLCRWVDHQVFVDSLVANWHRGMADAIEREDPNSVAWYDCTIEGWMRPGSAFDFWKLGSLSKFCVQYLNPIVHDILRETAAPDAYHGTWYGGYGIYNVYPYYDADTQPWWCVFRGINLHGLYYGGTGPSYFDERMLAADLRMLPMFEGLMETIDELRAGPAKLIFNADRQNDGVAITFSRPSNHMSVVLPRDMPRAPEWQGQYTDSPDFVYMQHWEALSFLLSDLGLSYKTMRCSDVACEEGLTACRLLAMPLNLRVTQDEAAAIRQFVSDGGVVLADAFPGWFDGEARPTTGMLADVFGVSYDGPLPGKDARRRAAATVSGGSLGTLAAAGSLTVDTAEPHAATEDGTPLFLVNSFGRGHAILLNVLARDYQIWRTLGTEGAFRETVADLIASVSGPRAPVICETKVRGDDALHRVPACEIHRYRLGDAEYVGLMRTAKLRPDDMIFLADNRPKPAWIEFSEPAHVYDVRRGVYRGFVKRFDDVLYPGRTEFYALLPYEVGGTDAVCSTVPGGVRVDVAVLTSGDMRDVTTHVLHFDVVDPSGNRRRELARNVVAERGRSVQEFFLGYNAAPGVWRIHVRDVATGTTRVVPVAIPADGAGGAG